MEENKTKEMENKPLNNENHKDKKKNKFDNKKIIEENKKLIEANQALNEKILRLSAETQNMKRHFEEDKMKLLKYDGESLILQFLPIVDNLERAIIMDDANLTDEVSKFLSGIKMIYGNLVDILTKYSITEIECIGQPFNPDTMNAVLIDHEEDTEDNIVIDCMQKGYMYKDKLLRPAMVKVNHKD